MTDRGLLAIAKAIVYCADVWLWAKFTSRADVDKPMRPDLTLI